MLCADPVNLAGDIAALETAGVPALHIDIMDGHFVPNIAIGFHTLEAIAKTTKLPLDAHLMLSEPGAYLPRLEGICRSISIHYEAVNFPVKILRQIGAMGSQRGIAIGPGTDARLLRPLLPHLDFVLCMTVEPGFAGQRFIESALDNCDILRALRAELSLDFYLEVDGSIGVDNIARCVERGVRRLVVGANLFPPGGSIAEAYRALVEAMETGCA